MSIQPSPANRALKIATASLNHGCGGGEGAAATLAALSGHRVRQQRMSDCGNLFSPDYLRINEAIALEAVASRDEAWPPVTRAMAAAHGFVLRKLPCGSVGAADWLKMIADLTKGGGAVSGGLADALSDGEVDRIEARAMLQDLRRLIEAAVGLEAQLLEVV